MAKNDFKPFATAPGANVTSQTDWEGLPALLSGSLQARRPARRSTKRCAKQL